MKRVCGLILFSIGIGMAIMICLPTTFCTVFIAVAVMILGYNLFCMGK
ncbi:MAG: hypothetical protein IJ468_02690 [Lachnospiraceae bacterium]|nr:hypothetical protein [Lachnospiraceae bacterium]